MEKHEPLRLHLGCGEFIKPGWINIDISPLPGVDLVHDLNKTPLPFDDESVQEIIADDLLEHVDYPALLKDCHRMLKPGGVMHIHVPHFTSSNNAVDPTHRHQFSVKTFNFFCSATVEGTRRSYYSDFKFSAIRDRRLIFHKGLMYFLHWPAEWFFNSCYWLQCWYEATGWSRIFPAQDLQLTIVK